MNRMITPWGEHDLTRFPEDPRDQLRAWDAADDYLLRHLAGITDLDLSGTVVVIGDRWGALTTALAGHGPVQISDSFLAQEATRANLARAGYAPDSVRLLSTRDEVPERVDVLLVRVPKSLGLLEDQLQRIAPSVHADTVVVGTGMVKEIHTSTLNLFERILGPTKTSLAEKKARLIFTTPDPALARPKNPWPLTYSLELGIGPASGLAVTNYAGVFCADRLDIGTRFLLQHLPERTGPDHVVDLGCGNGIVGTAAALSNPEARITFADESHPAMASAEATFRMCAGPAREAHFRLGDGLADFEPASADLVLNNPPFHTHQATTDRTSSRMFADARTALREGGELWVVGNRHLGYHEKLRRMFGNCELMASDPKFVVLRAVKQAR
ncbi:ribosomal RNA large subunit methyltransferase G [Streptomyces violascens]|uniref:Ribosomal RNA large subunit methyltransferase G n=2 Tax=Streptomyces violascens TaxID=67381 RepID=A0ABQ3QK55_9ACTN|nr:ribosomal RNA large subunit methyltransferase G [Streptomyces violascens]GHI37661.1 ribosomal RNA large subunit methyltransferase G [Streptomyces violascens]